MTQDKSFKEIVELTEEIIQRFKKIEQRPWGIEGATIELAKQVGQLSALVMSREKYYHQNREKENSIYEASKEKIGDELSDLLVMVIRIADYYKIDLEDAHLTAMKQASEGLKAKGV